MVALRGRSGQASVEAALLVPVVLTLVALLVQPACVLYTRAVMASTAAELTRLAATSRGGEGDVRAYALRRLAAVLRHSRIAPVRIEAGRVFCLFSFHVIILAENLPHILFLPRRNGGYCSKYALRRFGATADLKKDPCGSFSTYKKHFTFFCKRRRS